MVLFERDRKYELTRYKSVYFYFRNNFSAFLSYFFFFCNNCVNTAKETARIYKRYDFYKQYQALDTTIFEPLELGYVFSVP